MASSGQLRGDSSLEKSERLIDKRGKYDYIVYYMVLHGSIVCEMSLRAVVALCLQHGTRRLIYQTHGLSAIRCD